MRIRIAALLIFTFAVIWPAASAMAHHSFAAEFDANKPITLKGFVTKIDWTNPHVWIYMSVAKDDGTLTSWGFEMTSPAGLQRIGWLRNTLKLGDELVVTGSQSKNGSERINAKAVTIAKTGQKLLAGSSQNDTP